MFAKIVSALVLAAALTPAAHATTYTVFDGIAAGRADFDNVVVSSGGTVANDTWTGSFSGTAVDRGDYTITRNNGGSFSTNSYGSLSGTAMSIDPYTTAPGGSYPRTDPLDYFASGITFTFDQAINSFGFEVGDWATCCFDPTTDLYISFDGGSPILVASASEYEDGRFPTQNGGGYDVNEIFVAAFDDTGTFTTVSFWGNGIGEILVAGGDVRYAAIDEGSLPSEVPVPAAGLLLAGGLGLFGLMRRRA